MNRFYVLHLSDLHIRDSVNDTLKNLIISIANNKELQKRDIVIAITGDIIDRGNYEKFHDAAIDFFKELHEKTIKSNISVVDIHIVPGNHDKETEPSNKLFSIAQQSGIKFPDDGSKSHIPSETEVYLLQSRGFESFLSLCNEIFKIFNIRIGNKLKRYTESFGADKTTLIPQK